MKAPSKVKRVTIRGKTFVLCDYTGAPLEKYYYVPEGKKQRGCYATLPILLRAEWEALPQPVLHFSHQFEKLKEEVEQYYNQPDIPMAPTLSSECIPLSKEELRAYLQRLDTGMGESWLLVAPDKVGKA